ncbi:MAG TPA: hypothetical protein VJ951_15955, partial [Bacteroidales bacterium]|nr:hypothetical protein [Bacteroidales bacterium]
MKTKRGIQSIMHRFIPPPQWKIPVIIALALIFGISGFLFYISNAPSYLSDKPETCVNCHIMAP